MRSRKSGSWGSFSGGSVSRRGNYGLACQSLDFDKGALRVKRDIELLLASSVVAVIVVLITQLISDLGYVWLNPRIRLS